MNKWKIFAFLLIAISLFWFFLGFSYIAYCLASGIDFFPGWIIIFVAPCSLVWYISYRCIKRSRVTVEGVPSRLKELPPIEMKVPVSEMESRARKSSADSDVRADLLNKIKVYAEAYYYLNTCGPFDASKFEKLDEILAKAGFAFGPERRQALLLTSHDILTERPGGGPGELKISLGQGLMDSITALRETLAIVSPTPIKDVEEVVRILEKLDARITSHLGQKKSEKRE